MPSHGGLHHKQALTAAAGIRQLTLAPIVRFSTESPVYKPLFAVNPLKETMIQKYLALWALLRLCK